MRIRARSIALAVAMSTAIMGMNLGASGAARAQSSQEFAKFVEGVWPEAQAAGVSRLTFDRAFKGVTPDLTIPDLVLPGRMPTQVLGQAEFVKPPQDYLDRGLLGRLALGGKGFMAKYQPWVEKIERELGWRARHNFETGLRATIQWYLDNESWWRPLRETRYAGDRLGRTLP